MKGTFLVLLLSVSLALAQTPTPDSIVDVTAQRTAADPSTFLSATVSVDLTNATTFCQDSNATAFADITVVGVTNANETVFASLVSASYDEVAVYVLSPVAPGQSYQVTAVANCNSTTSNASSSVSAQVDIPEPTQSFGALTSALLSASWNTVTYNYTAYNGTPSFDCAFFGSEEVGWEVVDASRGQLNCTKTEAHITCVLDAASQYSTGLVRVCQNASFNSPEVFDTFSTYPARTFDANIDFLVNGSVVNFGWSPRYILSNPEALLNPPTCTDFNTTFTSWTLGIYYANLTLLENVTITNVSVTEYSIALPSGDYYVACITQGCAEGMFNSEPWCTTSIFLTPTTPSPPTFTLGSLLDSSFNGTVSDGAYNCYDMQIADQVFSQYTAQVYLAGAENSSSTMCQLSGTTLSCQNLTANTSYDVILVSQCTSVNSTATVYTVTTLPLNSVVVTLDSTGQAALNLPGISLGFSFDNSNTSAGIVGFTASATVEVDPSTAPPSNYKSVAGLTFSLSAMSASGVIPSGPLSAPVFFNLNVSGLNVNIEQLALYYYDIVSKTFVSAPGSCPVASQVSVVNPVTMMWNVSTCHLTQFAAFESSTTTTTAASTTSATTFDTSSTVSNASPSTTASAESSVSPTPQPNGGNSNKLSGGAIAGIVIGSVAGVIIIVLIVVFLIKRKGSSEEQSLEMRA